MSDYLDIANIVVLVLTFGFIVFKFNRHLRFNELQLYQNVIDQMFQWRSKIIEDPELAIVTREQEGLHAATETADTPKVYYHSLQLFHIFESLYLLHASGIIGDDKWRGWEKNIRVALDCPERRTIWERLDAKDIYHPGFVTLMNSTAENAAKAHKENPDV